MFAIVQVVETFLHVRVRFQSDFNHISILICDRQVDCCNLSSIPIFYSVNWIVISQKLCYYGIYSCYRTYYIIY